MDVHYLNVLMINHDPGLNDHDPNNARYFHMETMCNSLRCPPYDSEKELTCAVCTRLDVLATLPQGFSLVKLADSRLSCMHMCMASRFHTQEYKMYGNHN